MKTIKTTLNAYKFSSTATDVKPEILNGKTPQEFLKERFNGGYSFGVDNLKSNAVYKLSGWAFDFRPFLKLYFVEQYGHIQKCFAPNKTAIRKSNYGRITRIVEVK